MTKPTTFFISTARLDDWKRVALGRSSSAGDVETVAEKVEDMDAADGWVSTKLSKRLITERANGLARARIKTTIAFVWVNRTLVVRVLRSLLTVAVGEFNKRFAPGEPVRT